MDRPVLKCARMCIMRKSNEGKFGCVDFYYAVHICLWFNCYVFAFLVRSNLLQNKSFFIIELRKRSFEMKIFFVDK